MLTPRWYQSEANAAVWKYMSEKQGNPVVVLPTGAGKSLLIALLIKQALEYGGRVVVLAHRKELLQQNADEIRGLIPGVDVGIYSAGLKSKQIHNAVVVAGIQSVYRKAEDLGRRHLVIVDEAHLISDLEESMYGQFLAAMKANEGLRIVGLTATPFRTGAGPICGPERIFQRVVFEAKTAQLIAEGFLCPITNKVADAEVNTDKVGLRGGEFIESEMQAAFDVDEKVWAACTEIIEKTADRRSVLVFASGIHHAEQIASLLANSAVVTGDTLPIERAETLRRFVAGELRFLVNVDVLTTGFNARCVDAIAILRATMSPGLFCQMVGRGLRLHESKTNCIAEGQLVLTDCGLVEIQNVTTNMKLWDGVEFVKHDGVVFNGIMDVISYAGLKATGDHNVWTEKGWMPFGKAHNKKAGICITGDGRKTIRSADNRFRSDCKEEQRSPICFDRVPRMQEAGNERPGLRKQADSRLQKMWTTQKQRQASSGCPKMALAQMRCRKRQMRQQKEQKVCRLRRTRDYFRLCIAKRNGKISFRSLRDGEKSPNRSHRQQQGILSRKPQSSNSCCKHEQQKAVQTKAKVFDIINCGPRRRFTCQGLLVSNCYLLDFGGNIQRHGPIDDDNFGRSTGTGRAGVAAENGRGKQCPSCELDVSASAAVCPECNFLFPRNRELKHETTADESSQLTGQLPPETWQVKDVVVRVHTKKDDEDAPKTVRVDYVCHKEGTEGNLTVITIPEWVCPGHTGFARSKFLAWWDARSLCEPPDNAADAVALINMGVCRRPVTITTKKDGRWHRITECQFEGEKPTEIKAEEETRVYSGIEDDCPF